MLGYQVDVATKQCSESKECKDCGLLSSAIGKLEKENNELRAIHSLPKVQARNWKVSVIHLKEILFLVAVESDIPENQT